MADRVRFSKGVTINTGNYPWPAVGTGTALPPGILPSVSPPTTGLQSGSQP